MKCKFYGCNKRATKYLLNQVHTVKFVAINARAHPYCADHWNAVYRRYWL